MVIQDTSLKLGANTVTRSFSAGAAGYTGWGDLIDSGVLDTASTTTPLATDGLQENLNAGDTDKSQKSRTNGPDTRQQIMDFLAANGRVSFTDVNNTVHDFDGELKIEHDSLNNLLGLMSNRDLGASKKLTAYELFELLFGNFKERLNKITDSLGRGSRMNIDTGSAAGLGLSAIEYKRISPTENWSRDFYACSYNYESERMTYTTNGTVRTADGREIGINIEAVMSRSFEEYSELEINYRNYDMIDPLVINIEGGTAGLSDRKFFFDIDADGEEDNISLLAKGCGFLALDRNGDGVINDGSELFGTATGDGFGELAVFDLDGNGWIDENDEIFNRLRIWTKDEDGDDRLVALGVAGVGAIYLGKAAGEFTFKSQEDNSVLGAVTNTGIFLHENGTAGLVQQIDMASVRTA